MKPTWRPGLHQYDHTGKFDGHKPQLKKRGRRADKMEIDGQRQLHDDGFRAEMSKEWCSPGSHCPCFSDDDRCCYCGAMW